jgi:uncharacterized protein
MIAGRYGRAVLIPILAVLLCGMRTEYRVLKQPAGQPSGERAAQDRLPKSNNPIWQRLLACKVDYNNKTGIFSISVTPEVKAMAGQSVTLNGFVLPLDGSDHTKHFLLTRRTPVCMFCPPGEPNEVVEVVSPKTVLWTEKMVTVAGPLSLINNGEKGMFFKINATAVK